MLFSELLRFLSAEGQGSFRYHEQTLMWWATGLNMFGERWVRFMGGFRTGLMNFAAPSMTTLRKVHAHADNASTAEPCENTLK